MSYDLTLFRPPPGCDPLDAYHRIQREEPGLAAHSADLQQLADRVKSRTPGFEQFTGDDGSIELTHETQVQVWFTDRDIGISMPYFRQGITEMMRVVCVSMEALAEQGFVTFDPQSDKIVTTADFSDMTAQYRDTDKVLPYLVEDAKKRRPPARPWWKFW